MAVPRRKYMPQPGMGPGRPPGDQFFSSPQPEPQAGAQAPGMMPKPPGGGVPMPTMPQMPGGKGGVESPMNIESILGPQQGQGQTTPEAPGLGGDSMLILKLMKALGGL